MPYNLMAEFSSQGPGRGGLLGRVRRFVDRGREGTDWQALRDLTSGCRSGLTFFPVPAGRAGEADALAVSIPLGAAGPELWRELDALLSRLEAEFGATIVDLRSGEALTGDFAETVRGRLPKFAEEMAEVERALTAEETARWLEGMRARGLNLRHDRESLAELDAIVESERGHLGPDSVEEAAKYIGTFLGECLVATYGGQWRFSPDHGEWTVYFESLNMFSLPRSKAARHLSLGAEHSILHFFDSVGAMIERGVDPLLLDWGPATVEVFVSDGQSSSVIDAVKHHLVTPEGRERSARFIGALHRYYRTFGG